MLFVYKIVQPTPVIDHACTLSLDYMLLWACCHVDSAHRFPLLESHPEENDFIEWSGKRVCMFSNLKFLNHRHLFCAPYGEEAAVLCWSSSAMLTNHIVLRLCLSHFKTHDCGRQRALGRDMKNWMVARFNMDLGWSLWEEPLGRFWLPSFKGLLALPLWCMLT